MTYSFEYNFLTSFNAKCLHLFLNIFNADVLYIKIGNKHPNKIAIKIFSIQIMGKEVYGKCGANKKVIKIANKIAIKFGELFGFL